MDIITGVATGLVQLLVPSFLVHLGYLVHYKRNINELKNQMEELGRVRIDIQRSMEADKTKGQVINEEVKSWLERVDIAQHEVLKLDEELEANKGCLACNVHYRVGKELKSKIDKVKNLKGEGRFDAVSIPPPPPPGIEKMETPNFQLYAPTKSAMEQIVEALEDKKLNLIGVYGMGGVGKTTLVQETAKQLKSKGVFHRVVVATISQKYILTEIQCEIAEKLGFELKELNVSARASRLLEELDKAEKRTLIILDDLWEPLALSNVGIPCHGDRFDGRGKDGSGCSCNIIITTRSQEVCNQMGTQSNVEVKVLPEVDAWQLFRSTAGGCVDSPELYSAAGEVVRGCGGLPVALVTIGRSLRDKDLLIWKNAALQLKMSTSSPSTIPGMEQRVFSSIKLSYDYLRSKETQFCFLLCCLFPEDHVIQEDELFPFLWGEEVFEGTETLTEARDRLHIVLDTLKRSCLLLSVDRDEGESGVRMHDIIRDVAIWIASQEEHGFVVEARRGLDQWPNMKKMRNKCKRLSLMENRIMRLPEKITGCPHLMTLSLRAQKYPGLQDIPGGCFEGMTSLKVLDLVLNQIHSIPLSAFSRLKELRVLLLDDNKVDISLFGNMKNLEILSLSHCELMTLSQEMIMGGMTNLKSLNLSGNFDLIIPQGVVSRLPRLEELQLLLSFNGWEAEDGPNTAARLSQLASLSCLSMLEIEVPNIQLLINSRAVLVSNLSRFGIRLGKGPNYLYDIKCKRWIACYSILLPVVNKWVDELLEQTEQLSIQTCSVAGKSIYPESLIGGPGGGGGGGKLGTTGLNNLRYLLVDGVSDVEYILSTVDQVEEVVPFKRLEELVINSLSQLKKIYHGQPSLKGSLEKLRVLRIVRCLMLKPILPLNVARGLLWLEDMSIYSNSTAEEGDGASGDNQQEHKSGEMMVLLPNLKRLHIVNCIRLKHICLMSVVAQGFSQLEDFRINQCPALEELFADTAAAATTTSNSADGAEESSSNSVLVFPQLRHLELVELPNFSAICRGVSALKNYSFPVCESLVIYQCPKLKRLPISLESTPRPSLIQVEKTWFDQLEWKDPGEKQFLLQRLKVEFLSRRPRCL